MALTGCSRSYRDNLRTDAFSAPVRDQIEEAVKAAEGDSVSGATVGRLGEILLAYQLDEQALSCFQDARQADGKSARWPYYEGLILQRWRRHREAADAFFAAAKADPRLIAAHIRRGEELAELGLWEESRDAFRAVLELDPRSPRAHYGVGRSFENTNEIDRALEAYYQACGSFPKYGEARLALERLLEKKSDHKGAAEQKRLRLLGSAEPPRLDEFAGLLLANDVGPRGLTRTAVSLLTTGRPKAAQERLEAALHLDPRYLAAHVNMISAYALAGDYQNARRHYESALEISPYEATAHLHWGSALILQKRYAEAATVLWRSVANAPRAIEARALLAEALYRSGDLDAAEAEFRHVLRERDDMLPAARGLGLILAARRRWDEAIPLLERARALSGSLSEGVAEALAQAYRAAGHTQLAQSISPPKP